MRRILCILLTALLVVTPAICIGESTNQNPFERSEQPTYYICRPSVKCWSLENSEEYATLQFGEKISIILSHGEYTDIQYQDGKTGYVTTGFIVETYYPMIYLATDARVYFSPVPGLTAADFGYGACGLRWDERAIILFEQDGYLFLITEAGYAGYVKADTYGLTTY